MSSPASRVQANLQELFQANLAPGDAYIRFQLTAEIGDSAPDKSSLTSEMTFLLSMEQVQESLIIEADKITPLPSMPESVIGIINSHNQVFCVFDLAKLIQLHSQTISARQYQIIVLQTVTEKPIYLGLAVSRLQGMIRVVEENIQFSLKGFPPKIIPYLGGAVEFQGKMLPILEFNLITEAFRQFSR